MRAQDPGDGELGSGVDLGVVVEPDVLAGRVGLGLTQQGDRLSLQGRVATLGHAVRSHVYLRDVGTV